VKPADLTPRAVAVLVDGLITFVVLGYLVAYATGNSHHHGGSLGFHLNGWPAILWIVLSWAYWVVLEHVWGTTPGKRLFRLRVVGREGGNPTWGSSALRNLLRIADGFPFIVPYVVGVIVAGRDADHRRIGDRVAGTRVVTPSS
jgi:uncharacterized RDD family membrane protein YckC